VSEAPIVLQPGGPRSEQLIRAAYREEGLACPAIDERVQPTALLYPRSFVERVDAMPGEKVHDFCFIGGLYRAETYANRAWILDFARRRFTARSYLLLTDGRGTHEPLGAYDHTNVEPDVFVPKDQPWAARDLFHEHYFRILRSSEFTLCPAGDLPWSMRFFEAIMCRSIPIVSDLEHAGRNAVERSIGYQVHFPDQEHVYDEVVAEENLRRFLRHQTLIGSA
jgi:hypothetical protein